MLYSMFWFYSADSFYHNLFIHCPIDIWIVFKFYATASHATVNTLYGSCCAHIHFCVLIIAFLVQVYMITMALLSHRL